MTGRDPHEPTRAATPLELLFDLAFAVAFGVAGSESAHLLAEGHVGAGVLGFVFAMFAVCWAWINFTWFSSAFDTDDWGFRVVTMVQMIGVIVLALGLPRMFESLVEGGRVHNEVMVAGYVVMRLAMVVQWLRAARSAPSYRASSLAYARFLAGAQAGWIALAAAPVNQATFFACGLLLAAVEMLGPWLADQRWAGPERQATPWHPHHIAERYGLLTIITLGEGVIGTVASLSAVVGPDGHWTTEAVVVAIAGTGLTFGLWWTYYITPAGALLHRYRERSFVWGYGHLVVFAALAGVGAGLHLFAYRIEGVSHLGPRATLLALAAPVLVFVLVDYALFTWLTRSLDPLHVWLVAGGVVLLLAAVVVAGTSLPWALVLVMLAPAVTVVGYEVAGHRHVAAVLER
jgi:low temperature requirement protein LtrA